MTDSQCFQEILWQRKHSLDFLAWGIKQTKKINKHSPKYKHLLFSLHLTTFKLYCSGILTSCFCFYSDFNTYWTTRNFDRNQSSFKFLWLSQEIKCYAAKVFLNRELISKTRTFYWGIVYHNLASFFVQSFDVPLFPNLPF